VFSIIRRNLKNKGASQNFRYPPFENGGGARGGDSERKARSEGMPILINNSLPKIYLLYMLKPVIIATYF